MEGIIVTASAVDDTICEIGAGSGTGTLPALDLHGRTHTVVAQVAIC